MNRILGIILTALVVVAAGMKHSSAADGTSTPLPGGAYQLRGLDGSISSILFNGNIRIKKMSFRTATPKELILEAGETGVVFSCIVSNGTQVIRTGYLAASLVDADGIVLNSYCGDPMESIYALEPGAAARQSFRFTLKNGFNPVKLLLIEKGNGAQPLFRIALKPRDMS